MAILDLLFIYDASVDFVEERDDADYIIPHKGDLAALAERLRDLIKKNTAFRRAVVTTHGGPGSIKFNGTPYDAWDLNKHCANKGLHMLFPMPGARLYFNGCEVGAEPGGKEFITTAAQIFLRSMGGTAFAMTSSGSVFPLPWIHKGHILHYGGGIVSTTVGPGGWIVPELPLYWPEPPNHRDNIGNKI